MIDFILILASNKQISDTNQDTNLQDQGSESKRITPIYRLPIGLKVNHLKVNGLMVTSLKK